LFRPTVEVRLRPDADGVEIALADSRLRSPVREAVQSLRARLEMDWQEITRHLLERARWGASRSSGPGGQRRDKVETRAELTVEAASLEGLEPSVAARLAERLGLHERPLRITSQEERSLARNQAKVGERLAELVAAAVAPPPPRRRPTGPSRGQREARLSEKSARARTKRLRQPPGASD
jgi:ribosome-associated protein